jgi:hypothetical protein
MPRQSVVFDDFSGGLDLVSDPASIAPNMTRFARNMRIMGGGSYVEIAPRNAVMQTTGGGSLVASGVHSIGFFPGPPSAPNDAFLVVASDSKWIKIDRVADTQRFGGASSTDIRTGLTGGSSSDLGGPETTFVYHGGLLYGLSPGDNIATVDSTGTDVAHAPGVNGGPPKGKILGIWDNKMFTVVYPTSSTGSMTIRWSAVVDATNGFVNFANAWPTANTVTLGGSATASDEYITGAAVTPDGLVVFTTKRMFLLHDSSTGANTVIDENAGVIDGRSICVRNGEIWAANQRGVFVTTGRLPAQYVTDRYLKPLFDTHPLILNVGGKQSSMAASIYEGRYIMNLPYGGGDGNDNLLLEIDCETKAGMVHEAVGAMRDIMTVNLRADDSQETNWDTGAGDVLVGIGPILYATSSSHHLWKIFAREADSVTGMTFLQTTPYYQLPYTDFGDPSRAKRLRRASVVGRATESDIAMAFDVNYLERRVQAAGFSANPSPDFFGTLSGAIEWSPVGADLDDGTVRPFGRQNGIVRGVRGHSITATLYAFSDDEGQSFPGPLLPMTLAPDTPMTGAGHFAISRVELEADILPGAWRS